MSDWEKPPLGFRYILFERVNPERNEARFYYLSWQPTLIHSNAVVRLYGRRGESQHWISPQPFSSLEEAWPSIRKVIKTRLRHGYRIVQPEQYCHDEQTKPQ